MQMEDIIYRGCVIRPLVTQAEAGRYTAAAAVTDREGETRTLGVEGDFAGPQEAWTRQWNWRLHGSIGATLSPTIMSAADNIHASFGGDEPDDASPGFRVHVPDYSRRRLP